MTRTQSARSASAERALCITRGHAAPWITTLILAAACAPLPEAPIARPSTARPSIPVAPAPSLGEAAPAAPIEPVDPDDPIAARLADPLGYPHPPKGHCPFLAPLRGGPLNGRGLSSSRSRSRARLDLGMEVLQADAALDHALTWLIGRQRGDGSWSSGGANQARGDLHCTCLALLALHCDARTGVGDRSDRGIIQAGFRWLAAREEALFPDEITDTDAALSFDRSLVALTVGQSHKATLSPILRARLLRIIHSLETTPPQAAQANAIDPAALRAFFLSPARGDLAHHWAPNIATWLDVLIRRHANDSNGHPPLTDAARAALLAHGQDAGPLRREASRITSVAALGAEAPAFAVENPRGFELGLEGRTAIGCVALSALARRIDELERAR